jgi:RNA polymerase sigma-70 factor (ECF subfamily)
MSLPVDVDAADADRAVAGDESAFGRLYGRHAKRIHMLARRLVGPDEADDATQDIFIRAWSKLKLFRGESSFGTWLHRLAVNLLIRRAGTLRRETLRIEPGAHDVAHEPSTKPDDRMDVSTVLASLEPGLRQVVVLHDMEGYSHDEIARLLDIGISASRMRLHRARSALRANFRLPENQSND